MKKKFDQILSELTYLSATGKSNLEVTGVFYDSRNARPGSIFVAIPGSYADGHEFIPQAIENGARVVVGERPYRKIEGSPEYYLRVEDARKTLAQISHLFYDRPTEELFVVGITGTNGKTTTAHLTRLVLGDGTDLISTLTHSESPPEEEPVTTPEAPEIHETARKDVEKGERNLVLEVSSHGLSLERVSWVDFDCGVFTNLTRDHLDFYDSMEEYAGEKMKLFSYLSGDDTAIINKDEEFSKKIADETDADLLGYGIEEITDVYADEIERRKNGVSFKLNSPWGSAQVGLKLPGLYNVYNALAAVSVGLVRGVSLTDAVTSIEGAKRLSGRLEKLELNNGSDVYIDFAHNPGALERSLLELQAYYERVLLVFGCGGTSDRGKRPEMGEVAARHADRFFITDDNPKGEDRSRILQDIERGVREGANYAIIPERKDAIEAAIDELTPGSCLLVAGKGHEQYQIVSGEWIEYNDREYVEKLAGEKSLLQ